MLDISLRKKYFAGQFIIKLVSISRRNLNKVFYNNNPMITENRLQVILAIIAFFRLIFNIYFIITISTRVTKISPVMAKFVQL